ncbi:MAG TPA: 4-alpha-glucanotransferase [Drouetiella sp.]
MKINTKEKLAGILVPVFALRHENDLGIGDTAAMRDAIDFCAHNKIGILQVLPINETGGDNSPYGAISSVALDPALIYIAPDTIPGLTREEFNKIATPELLTELRSGTVKYPQVKKLKAELLRAAFEKFEATEVAKKTDKAKALNKFEEENTRWLKPYSLFRALMDEHDGNAVWTQWEPELQDYKKAEMSPEANTKPDRKYNRRFWSFVQWIAYQQWGEIRKYADAKAVQLMGDLPFGVSRYSVDVWAEKQLFDLDWSCGAPPETFFQGDIFVQKWGQNWGMPLYRWSAHKKENYAWWRQRVKQMTELFHYFRIDHVLGFFRVYAFPWIPERNGEFIDLTEAQAAKLTGGKLPQFLPRSDEEEEDAEQNCADGETIMKMLLDAAGEGGIVAEDLGTVPPYVRPLIHKLGIAGFAIPIFERVEETREFKDKDDLPALSLATYGTHDHQPIASFYKGLVEYWHGPKGEEGWKEVQRLMRFLGLDEEKPPLEFDEKLHLVFMQVLLETHCWVGMFMITDLLGTTQRFNEPGVSGDLNWSQRLDKPLTAYEKDPQYSNRIKKFAELIQSTKRAPKVLSASV